MIKRIFIYWHSSFDNCPLIIKQCLKSWKFHNKDYEIIELNDSNLLEWINISELIKNKNITKTSLSDIIRIFLLKNHGGFWVDSTVFCVKPLDDWIINYAKNGFFAYSFDELCDRMISSWFLYGEQNNYIIDKWYHSVIEYIQNANIIGIEHNPSITIDEWKNRDKYNNHYFWFHYLFGNLYNENNEFRHRWDDSNKISNVYPHYIQTIGLESKVDNYFISNYNSISPLYKLTYRYNFDKCDELSVLQFLYNTNI
jgi:hypothetical protein